MVKMFMLFLFMFIFLNYLNFMIIWLWINMVMLLLFCLSLNYNMNLIYGGFGLDYISYYLIFLSLWIFMMMLMSLNNMNLKLILLFIILLFNLFMIFMSLNMFIFYIFFEFILIPMMIIILKFGKDYLRLKSIYYMMFYTLMFSLMSMISLMKFFKINKSLIFMYFNFYNINLNNFLMTMIILMFLVKVPMFLIHIWLPMAHVEAPVYGSMLLAGVLLKLGIYGLIRLFYNMKFNLHMNLYIISISMVGSLLISLKCLYIDDMKLIVAYSSVVHMGLALIGFFVFNYIGFLGLFWLMLGHGLCSSGLFYLVNVIYERSNSRMLLLNKGLMNIMTKMSILWFLLCSSNMSAPLSLNLIGEILLFSSIISLNYYMIIMLIFISFFSFLYSLNLFSFSQHGKFNILINKFNSGNFKEYFLLIMHWMPLNLMFLNMK